MPEQSKEDETTKPKSLKENENVYTPFLVEQAVKDLIEIVQRVNMELLSDERFSIQLDIDSLKNKIRLSHLPYEISKTKQQ